MPVVETVVAGLAAGLVAVAEAAEVVDLELAVGLAVVAGVGSAAVGFVPPLRASVAPWIEQAGFVAYFEVDVSSYCPGVLAGRLGALRYS